MSVCQRCYKETIVTTCSWFNTDTICMACSEKEKKDPRFKEAQETERKEVRQGNYNFKGIGL